MNDAPDNPTGSDWRSPGRFALVLALLIFIPFHKVLMGIDTFAVRDFGLFSYPVASFFRHCFWKGEMPFWNPLSCCGVPFLAQFNTLTLYPPSLIYLLLPLAWALPFFCLLHLFFGGMGAYFLAARWTNSRAGAAIAGVAFAFNGLALNLLMWPSHIASYAWMPWVILLVERGWTRGGRALAAAAFAAAFQVLAGGPEEILFSWLVLLIVGIVECRKREVVPVLWARRFLLMGMLGICLAAAQLLPCADFALHCNRNTHYATSEWSMPPWGWANFLAPLFQTWQWLGMQIQLNQYWTSSYYVGIGTVFLAAVALCRRGNWRIWLVGGIVGASLILALGDFGFVYLGLRKLLPFLGLFRFPIKFVILTSLLLPVLAAFAVSQYENCSAPLARSWRAERVCGAAFVVLLAVLLWFAKNRPVMGSSWEATWPNTLIRLAFLAALIAAAWFFATRPAWRGWSVLLLTILLWGDLVTAVPWQNPTLDPSVYQPDLGILAAKLQPPIPAIAESRLMMSPYSAHHIYSVPSDGLRKTYLLDRSVFLSDCNLIDNVPKVDGFFSLYLKESDKVLWQLDERTNGALDSLEDFLGVSQTIAPGEYYNWAPRTNYLPIVSIGQEPVFADGETAFQAILRTNVDYRKVVYLPPDARSRITAKAEPDARVLGKQFDEDRERIEVESPQPAMVYISQAYYHDWMAEVDGRAVPLWRANYAFQAVEIPAGKHELRLVYRDKMFRIGTFMAAWAVILCVVLFFAPAERTKAEST